MQNICVSGIHTEIGKTAVSAALCAGFGYEYFKLIQAGENEDRARVEHLLKVAGKSTKTHPNGISLATAASPHIASQKEGLAYNALDISLPFNSGILLELAGGLYTPLGGAVSSETGDLSGGFMIDYIAKHNLGTFLVSADYLGAINHTLLSLNALASKGIDLLGVIVSGDDKVLGEFLKGIGVRVFRLDKFNSSDEFIRATNALCAKIKEAGVLC